jgi:mRNA-degrading endonuclease toxin of MazEF toxin-antitoxin module
MILKRRLGFRAPGRADRVVVVQARDINAVAPTTIVVPLDEERNAYAGQPRFVAVSAAESGTDRRYTALVTLLTSVSLDRLEPSAVGRLSALTLAKIDRALRIILDLA